MSHLELRLQEYAPDQLDIVTPRIRAEKINPESKISPWDILLSQHVHPALEMHHISPRSAIGARKALEKLAYYFRREFQYDFILYHSAAPMDPRDRAFLVTWQYHDHRAAIGAIVFRWRKYEDAPHDLALQWLWLHPYLRRHGLLSTCWPSLREPLGDFYIEGPTSRAMADFLTKMGECPRCGVRRSCQKCKAVPGSSDTSNGSPSSG
jgi:hypothetical protein